MIIYVGNVTNSRTLCEIGFILFLDQIMNKYIIIFIILIISNIDSLLYSDDNSDDNDKIFLRNKKLLEISLGISQINYISIIIDHLEYIEDTNYVLIFNEYYFHKIFISIPFSYVYYLNNNIGIGFLSEIGIGLNLLSGISPNLLIINIRNKIISKIGYVNKSIWLLLETGININILFLLYSSNAFYNYYPSIGQNMLIGYEQIISKYLGFTLGLILDCNFSEYPIYNFIYGGDIGVTQWKIIINIDIGIEIRFKFDYIKYL